MSSIKNSPTIPARSPSVASVRSNRSNSSDTIRATPLDTVDNNESTIPKRSPTPLSGIPRPQSQLSSRSLDDASSIISDISQPAFAPEVRAAIDEAHTKDFSQLVREVATTTSGARGITKVMSYIGLGVSLGLLFAHQPFAVVLVAPAFTALGLGISYVMRAFINKSQNPSVEAFKELMAEVLESPTAEDEAHPDFAEAKKLYNFLTQSYVSLGKAHLNEMLGKVLKATAPKAPASSLRSQSPDAGVELNSLRPASVDEVDESGVQTPKASEADLSRTVSQKTFATAKESLSDNDSIQDESDFDVIDARDIGQVPTQKDAA